jgi:hypothetical protein
MHLALKARFSANGHLFHQWNDAGPTRLKRAFSACSVGNLNSWGQYGEIGNVRRLSVPSRLFRLSSWPRGED